MMKGVLILSIIQTILAATARHQLNSITQHHLSSQPIHQGFLGGGGGGVGFGGIFFGFIFGPFLFICSFVCIWFNEKRAAIDSRRLNLADSICEDVDVNSEASAMHQNGKLVYGCGETWTNEVIRQPISGVMGPNLIKIRAQVEVKQWRKHQRDRQEGGGRSVYYTAEWVSAHSDNQGGRSNSPQNWFLKSNTVYNQKVFLGGYNIDKTTSDMCEKTVSFTPSLEHAHNILRSTNKFDRVPSVVDEYIYFTKSNNRDNYNYQRDPSRDYYNQGSQYQSNGVGDLRVRYILCPTGPISIAARSTGATFSDFPIAEYEGTADEKNSIPQCCCCCISQCYAQLLEPIENIHLVKEEIIGKHELFQDAIQKSQCLTRGLRIGCYFLMVFSITLFFSPITTIIGYIPLVGGFISSVLFFAILLAALLVCIPLFLIATSIAWLRFRPKIGFIIIGIAVIVLAIILVINSTSGNSGAGGTSHLMASRHF